MKKIEDITRMSLEELELIAGDQSVRAPESLTSKVEDAIMAQAAVSAPDRGNEHSATAQGTVRRPFRALAGFALAAAAAACLTLFVTIPRQPHDTFDDPMMAYAELERALGLISAKMDRGLEIAAQTGQALEKTTEIYK